MRLTLLPILYNSVTHGNQLWSSAIMKRAMFSALDSCWLMVLAPVDPVSCYRRAH